MTFTEMNSRIKNAPQIDFGEIFNETLQLFQKVWLQGLLLQVLIFAISWGISILMLMPTSLFSVFIDSGELNTSGEHTSIGMLVITWVLQFVVYVVLAIVNFALQAAFYRIMRMKDRNSGDEAGVSFGMYFKKEFVQKIAILAVVQAVLSFVAVLLCVFPIFYVIVPIQFAVAIFAFNPNFSAEEIYRAAFTLGTQKWGVTFALLLVFGILAVLCGILACGVGLLVTLPILYLPVYLIYKKVIGFTEVEDEIARIGEM